MQRHVPTEEAARRSLADHVVDVAVRARARFGGEDGRVNLAGMLALAEDRSIVRYPVEVGFSAQGLQPGEFAYMEPLGAHPSEGFRLHVHPTFEGRDSVLPMLIAYHLVVPNYGDIAGADEAELFGATLLGLEVHDYYQALCAASDEVKG